MNNNNCGTARRLGQFAIILANMCWGFMYPVLKDLLNSETVSPWGLAGTRMTVGALLLWGVCAIAPKSWNTRQRIDRKDFLPIFLASMLVIALNQTLVLWGMKYSSPVEAAVILTVTPIFTVLFSFLFLRQKMRLMQVAGVALGFAGITWMTLSSTPDAHAESPILGGTFCLLSQVFGALYLVMFSRIIMKYSALTLIKWMFTMASLVILPITMTDIIATPWHALSLANWSELTYIVLIGTCLCYLLLPIAQRHVSPTTIAMCNYLQPIVGAVSLWLFGFEELKWITLWCAAIIFFSIWMVNRVKN